MLGMGVSVLREKGTGGLSLSPSVTQHASLASTHTFMRWAGAYRALGTLHCHRLFSHVSTAWKPLLSSSLLLISSSCAYRPARNLKTCNTILTTSVYFLLAQEDRKADYAHPKSSLQLHSPAQYRVVSMRSHGHHISWLARR